ncbi:MAG: hypothetical protein IJV71_00890 [Lachnospiraceae bacterium]|nr:hypothetical protein [Lachnospiraceae bacterium]
MVRKVVIITVLMACFLLNACSYKDKIDSTTNTNQQESSETGDGEGETTTENASASEWNPAEEGETLCYEAYSDEQLEAMKKVFENEMSEEMLSYINTESAGWSISEYWECLLISDMEIDSCVDNERYSVECGVYEHYDNRLHIQINYPHIEIKGNVEATDIANEEIHKLIAGNDYGLTEVEFLERYAANTTMNREWYTYYTIGYMDETMMCIIIRDAMGALKGIYINVETGKSMTLEELGVADEMLLNELERTPDHIVSAFYMKYSKERIEDMIERGYSTENSFIIGNRLYIWASSGRTSHIYFGYDNILVDIR